MANLLWIKLTLESFYFRRLQDYELRESASVILDANILNSNAEGSKQTLLQQAQIPIHQHELEKQQPTGKTKQRRESMNGQSSLLASRLITPKIE